MNWLKEHAVFAEFAKFGGFTVMASVAFFGSTGSRVAVICGGVLLGLGYFWGKLVK